MKQPRDKPLTAEELLHDLLDRYEMPKDRTRDITKSIDYQRVGGPDQQDEFHRILLHASKTGGITLETNRFSRITDEFARVRLVDAERLYKFLARTPSNETADATRDALVEAIPDLLQDPFFQTILDEALFAWRFNKRFLNLIASQHEALVTILRLTHGVMHLSGRDIDHRTFSRRTVRDSKALERSEGRVVQLLKRWRPELIDDESREVLEACGIVRRAHSLFVKGPLILSSHDMTLRGTGSTFLGLPWSLIQKISLHDPVDYVITIENPTSFWRYCTEVEGSYLALLTDGFPARDVLSGMTHLINSARQLNAVPLFHWGDIDAGGLRIAAHLEDAFNTQLILHDMTPVLALQFGSPLSSRQGLNRLAERQGQIGELARWLSCDEALALEQEELDPRAPLL